VDPWRGGQVDHVVAASGGFAHRVEVAEVGLERLLVGGRLDAGQVAVEEPYPVISQSYAKRAADQPGRSGEQDRLLTFGHASPRLVHCRRRSLRDRTVAEGTCSLRDSAYWGSPWTRRRRACTDALTARASWPHA